MKEDEKSEDSRGKSIKDPQDISVDGDGSPPDYDEGDQHMRNYKKRLLDSTQVDSKS